MYNTAGAPQRARWEVLWISKGRVQRKDCGQDIAEAIRVYGLVLKADRPGATLRCKNIAFPPPDKYADYTTEVIRTVRKNKAVRVKTKVILEPRRYTDAGPMGELNRKGVFWCPYCIKMRRFEKAEDDVGEPVMRCPMCHASHRLVMKYNPKASRGAGRKTRSDKGKRRSRNEA